MKEYKLSSRSGKLLLREEIDTKISTLRIGGPSVNTNTADSNINIDKAPSGSSNSSGSSGSSGSTPPPTTNGTIPPGDSTDPGTSGFGVGVAPTKWVNEYGLTPMEGYNIPGHENYGNYTDHTGSVMVWIPRHFVKFSHVKEEPYLGTRVDVSKTLQNGYTLPRCFINNGVMIDGLFIDKYKGSLENNVLVSKRLKVPLGYDGSDFLGNMSLNGEPLVNDQRRVYSLVKSRGQNYSVPTIFTFTMLDNLADAHFQQCYRENKLNLCAWGDRRPYIIKSPSGTKRVNGKLVLFNLHDPEIIMESSSNGDHPYLAGGVIKAQLAKTMHNGQLSGVTDLYGWISEITSGFFMKNGLGWCILKHETDIKQITQNNIVDTTLSLYRKMSIDTSYTRDLTYLLNNHNLQCVFQNSWQILDNRYLADNIGIPYKTNLLLRLDEAGTAGNEEAQSNNHWLRRFGFNGITIRDTTGGEPYVLVLQSGPRSRHLNDGLPRRNSIGVRCALVPSTGQPIPASLLGGG